MLNSLCVFNYKWVDSNIGVRTDDLRFTLVDLNKLAYQNEPFIMAEQDKQVLYVQDPCDEMWLVVLHRKTISVNLQDDDSTVDTCTLLSPYTCLMSMEKKKLMTPMQIIMIMMKEN